MPSTDFIPRSDEGFRKWVVNFSTNLSAAPAAFMMSQAEAQGVQSRVDDFLAAYEIATNDLSRNKGTIAAKQDARSIAESLCRQYAKLIKQNRGITDGDKISLGVRPINPKRVRQNCPQTSPILAILGNTPGMQTLTYRCPSMGDSRDKPFGAQHLDLFRALRNVRGAASVEEAKFFANCSRNPIEVRFTEEEDGLWATYYARWSSRRGATGPWSQPVCQVVAA